LTPLTPRAKATRGQTRVNNLGLALQIIFDKAPTSRAEVARESNLTPATASDLVDELLAMDLEEQVGFGVSAGGKPPVLIAPKSTGRQIIALDISSPLVRGAIVELSGNVVEVKSIPGATRDEGVAATVALVEQLLAASTVPALGIGVGAPGVVEPELGLVTSANLHWSAMELRAAISAVTDAPVHLLNDAQGAALSEYTEMEGDTASLVLVRVGFGIGAGYILDGHLFRGDNPAIGEIGHVRLDGDGPQCACGNTGCLESKASMSAVLRALGRTEPLSRAVVEDVARDPEALGAIATAATELGRVLCGIVAALAVSEVKIWGEATELGEEYRKAVEDEVRNRVLSVGAEQLTVNYATAGDDAVMRGAAGLVLSSELGVTW
jgi:predicted NBD/HSP70 family sugar kinase